MNPIDRKKGLFVRVDNDNVEKALRKLKKKVQAADLFKDLEKHDSYIKPTTKKKQKRSAARKRWEKHLAGQQLPPKNY